MLPFQSVTQRGHTDIATLSYLPHSKGTAERSCPVHGMHLGCTGAGEAHELWAHSDVRHCLFPVGCSTSHQGPWRSASWKWPSTEHDRGGTGSCWTCANTPCKGRHHCLGGEGWGELGPAPLALQKHSSFIPCQQWTPPGASPAVFWSFALQQIKKKNPICSKTFGLLKWLQMLHERQRLVAESVTTPKGSFWPLEN